MADQIKAAIVQHAAIHLNLDECLKKAALHVEKAADNGARIIVFGETWLTGYPIWLDHCPDVALWNNPAMKEVYLRLVKSSITVPGPQVDEICRWARDRQITIVMGINERIESGPGNGTIYNSFIIADEQGRLVNHRRKLMPTFSERLLYGHGDGHDLNSVRTGAGQISGLICWEHWMPLARQALHESGEQIHVALWPAVHEMHQICSRQYAFEGRCFVLAAGQTMQAKDFPEELWTPQGLSEDPDKYVLNGGSCVIGPDGQYLIEPMFDRDAIIYAELDLDDCIREQMALDVTGQYARRDVLQLTVNRERG